MSMAFWGATTVERLVAGDVILRYGSEMEVKKVYRTPKGHLLKVDFSDGTTARYAFGHGLNILRDEPGVL